MDKKIYEAIGHQVFVHDELFLTIHPTNSGKVSMEEQAKLIAFLLNEKFKSVGGQ